MNVASIDLCRELHELSGWDFKQFIWIDNYSDKDPREGYPKVSNAEPPIKPYVFGKQYGIYRFYPAYDLGYLLRKLPKGTSVVKEQLSEQYNAGLPRTYRVSADTPEDCAAKLAIELFKQGVLTKEKS